MAWSKVGQTAIDFRGIRPDSTTLSLSDLRGKVVVIDVWATWCAPCIRMMPYFKQLEKELSHPDLGFMLIDREGRVLSFAAPAPNKPELKAMILEALNAKQ